MNKENALILLIILLLAGCSLIGNQLGEEVDKSVHGDSKDQHKYESQYMVEGLEWDIAIIKAIFSSPKEEPVYIDTGPCKEKNTVQVCSVKKGCW